MGRGTDRRWSVALVLGAALLLGACGDDGTTVAGGAGSTTSTAAARTDTTGTSVGVPGPTGPGGSAPAAATVAPASPADGPCPLLTVDELATALDVPPGAVVVEPAQTEPTVIRCHLRTAEVDVWLEAYATAEPPTTTTAPPGVADPAAALADVGEARQIMATGDRSNRALVYADVWQGGTLVHVRLTGGVMAGNGRPPSPDLWTTEQATVAAGQVLRQIAPHL